MSWCRAKFPFNQYSPSNTGSGYLNISILQWVIYYFFNYWIYFWGVFQCVHLVKNMSTAPPSYVTMLDALTSLKRV